MKKAYFSKTSPDFTNSRGQVFNASQQVDAFAQAQSIVYLSIFICQAFNVGTLIDWLALYKWHSPVLCRYSLWRPDFLSPLAKTLLQTSTILLGSSQELALESLSSIPHLCKLFSGVRIIYRRFIGLFPSLSVSSCWHGSLWGWLFSGNRSTTWKSSLSKDLACVSEPCQNFSPSLIIHLFQQSQQWGPGPWAYADHANNEGKHLSTFLPIPFFQYLSNEELLTWFAHFLLQPIYLASRNAIEICENVLNNKIIDDIFHNNGLVGNGKMQPEVGSKQSRNFIDSILFVPRLYLWRKFGVPKFNSWLSWMGTIIKPLSVQHK